MKRIIASEKWFNYVITFFLKKKSKIWVGRTTLNGEKKEDGLILQLSLIFLSIVWKGRGIGHNYRVWLVTSKIWVKDSSEKKIKRNSNSRKHHKEVISIQGKNVFGKPPGVCPILLGGNYWRGHYVLHWSIAETGVLNSALKSRYSSPVVSSSSASIRLSSSFM